MEIKCVSDERALLGESPVWSSQESAVYWIDILGKKLHRTTPYNRKTKSWEMPSFPGMVALRGRGGLVITLQDGVYSFDPYSAQLDLLVTLEADEQSNRPNDGKCDEMGRLWIGTMNALDVSCPTGNFYRVAPDLTVTKIRSDYCIPNGLAWNPENKLMFHTDSLSNVVHTYEFDSEYGTCGTEKDFFHFNKEKTGGVDGAAMDVKGGYWAALYGGRKLIRILPDGNVGLEVPLPISQPTMPAFGGSDMKTLFVTSACQDLDNDNLRAQPLAGGLLAIPVDVAGHQTYPFGG
jgi:sugar lactone lactonase YvrE